MSYSFILLTFKLWRIYTPGTLHTLWHQNVKGQQLKSLRLFKELSYGHCEPQICLLSEFLAYTGHCRNHYFLKKKIIYWLLFWRNNMYSSFYDLEASSHVATIRQLHQVLEANLHVLEEVCVRITIQKIFKDLDQIKK